MNNLTPAFPILITVSDGTVSGYMDIAFTAQDAARKIAKLSAAYPGAEFLAVENVLRPLTPLADAVAAVESAIAEPPAPAVAAPVFAVGQRVIDQLTGAVVTVTAIGADSKAGGFDWQHTDPAAPQQTGSVPPASLIYFTAQE